jgi:DNA-binding SARP family transcriptional activator
MTSACLRLLGSPEFLNAKTNQSVRFSYTKLILLLSYLALEPKVHTREALADLFWPKLGANEARANLRRALFNLQQAFAEAGLPKSLILADRNTVRLSKEDIWIDALEFEKAGIPDCPTIISQQLALYKGVFLDGISSVDIEQASWVQNRRVQYEQQSVAMLERLIALTAVAGDLNAMERNCRHLIAIDNLNELAHSSLIYMNMDSGNESMALKIYEAYHKKLQAQLGIDPPEKLAALVEGIPPQRRADFEMAKATPAVLEIPASEETREYRLVSVLYIQIMPCISMDQEEWLALSAIAVQRLHALTSKYKGTFRQLSSFTTLIYFGYPSANECAPRWAIDVGLCAHALMATEYEHIHIRSAIHTDVMITGSGNVLPDLIGECTMIARHLAESAAVGALLVSEETLQGLTSFFDVTPVNGAPHRAFEIHARRGSNIATINRDERSFVGRTQQLSALHEAWEKAGLAGGANVLLIGAAGSGKSRLLRQFISSSEMGQEDVCSIRFLPEHSFLPLRPVLSLIRSCCEISEDTAQEIEHKLTGMLAEAGLSDQDSVQVLVRLLSKHGEFSGHFSKSQRARLFTVIVVILRKRRDQVSLVTLAIEDMHWADALSLEFVSWLRKRSKQLRLFLIITNRKRPYVVSYGGSLDILIELTPLQPEEALALASQYPQFLNTSLSLQHRMLEMADGIPLFIEQILGGSPEQLDKIGDLTCPVSLRNLLMMQIDWLGDLRQILCHASCIGWQFTLQILAAIESISPQRCRQLINKMIAAELVEKLPEQDRFQFRYRLIREVAYSTLTRTERKKMHGKIADFYAREQDRTKNISSDLNTQTPHSA